MFLETGEIGEIVVSGDVVTKSYENNDFETELAKTTYDNKLWHRMGDTGYLDEKGRLWFCGRKAHRVQTAGGTKFSVQCEAIVNNHPDIFRSALVGIGGDDGFQIPVLVVEKNKICKRSNRDILPELQELTANSPLTADITHFLFHPDFPVDIRHNAKIFREKLALWAEQELTQ